MAIRHTSTTTAEVLLRANQLWSAVGGGGYGPTSQIGG
jgi:hypothetical protein